MVKSIYKSIFNIIFIVIITLMFTGVSAKTTSLDSDFHSIDETNVTFKVGEMTFETISYSRNTKGTDGNTYFGILGSVRNEYELANEVTVTVYYYNSNMKLLNKYRNKKFSILADETLQYTDLTNVSESSNYSLDDIKYYKLNVYTNDYNGALFNTSYSYTIDRYNINIKVNENNILDITENIQANFKKEKHGIMRKIPMENTIYRLDGTYETNHPVIRNIKVNDQFTTYNEKKNKIIKIGDPNKTITGKKDYQISYSYNLNKDKTDKYDELYFNLIGSQWDTVIDNITFRIVMPKTFDASKLGFSSGVPGSTDSSKITYQVNGNTITGSYNGSLNHGVALTIRLELPEGYFKNFINDYEFDFSDTTLMSWVLCLGSLVIVTILFLINNIHRRVIETVEFYPPNNLNSAEVALLYKGKIIDKDIISLLIYLASKGYLSIHEMEENNSLYRNSFFIKKGKQYDGNKSNERLFLMGLFWYGDTVSEAELMHNFYPTILDIKNELNKTKKLIYSNISIISKGICWILIISIFLITYLQFPTEDSLPFMGIFIAFIILLMAINDRKDSFIKLITILFYLLIFFAFGLVPFNFFISPHLLSLDASKINIFIICHITILIIFLLKNKMVRKTDYGYEMLGKIKGFKRFLELAEKERIEALVNENPNYFFDILPFAYVLGITDQWIKKFEGILLKNPDWYPSTHDFNINHFHSSINNTMHKAERTMTSRLHSSSGGSSYGGSSGGSSGGGSGGGSSGGGSGGGGGGSW